MKSWFRPRLDPGERIVLRHPPVWFVLLLILLVVGIASAPIIAVMSHARADSWSTGSILSNLAVGAVVLTALLFFLGRWQVAVTNRRVLVRRGFLGLSFEVIERADIVAADFINSTLLIVGKKNFQM